MARPRKNAAKVQGSLLAPDEVAEIPVEEQPYPLPEGWKWVRLGDITEIVGGGTPSSRVKEYYDNGNIPWLSPADLSDYHEIYICRGKKMLTVKGLNSSSARMIPAETVCLSSRAPIGYVVIAKNPLCTNQGFKSFLPSHLYIPKFLYWYLKGNKPLLESYASGTTFLELSGAKAAQIEFPLSPLGEQQRIVDRIESLFAKLDEAKAKAEAVLDGFEIRKAAILHKAFTGELTAKWREIRGIKKENNTVKIKDILSDIKYGTSEKSDYTYTGLPVIRIPNITGSSVDLEDLKFLKSSKSSDYDLVERNDILMIRSNGSRELVGKCALVDEAIVGKAYASFLIRLRPNPTINPKYLLGFLNSSLARNQLFAKAKSSAGIHNINSKEICSVDIWLPDKKEQQEIVRILDNLLAKERHIREAAENALSQIDLMKKAILARAFRGELGTHGSARDTLQNNGSM